MVGVWSDGWRHELADISVDEYQRRRTVSSSHALGARASREDPAVEKASAILWTGTHARLGTKIKVVRKKTRRPPNIGRGAEKCLFGERQVCQALIEPDSNVTVMIEIAEGFTQDLYQEGDLYAERDNKDPAASNVAASWY